MKFKEFEASKLEVKSLYSIKGGYGTNTTKITFCNGDRKEEGDWDDEGTCS